MVSSRLQTWSWSWKPGDRAIVASHNPYYWKVDPQGNQLPYIDYIDTVLIEDAQARLLEVSQGKFEATFRGTDDPTNIPFLLEQAEAKLAVPSLQHADLRWHLIGHLQSNKAKDAVRDSWDRTDRTFSTYKKTDEQFRTHYPKSNYFDKSFDYDRDYAPAYRYGTFSRNRYADRAWDTNLENELSRDWDRFKGSSRLTWEKAKNATKDAWHRVENRLPGDMDRDGR